MQDGSLFLLSRSRRGAAVRECFCSPSKPVFALRGTAGGHLGSAFPSIFASAGVLLCRVAGVRAARLLRRRIRGRLFPVCGFGLDALSFNLFHLAFFCRGAAAGLLRVSSCFLLFGFSFLLFPCLAGRLIRSRAGKRGEGSEGSGRSFQDGSPSFRLLFLSSFIHTHTFLLSSVGRACGC